MNEDVLLIDWVYDVFYVVCNCVEFYEDVLLVLVWLSVCFLLIVVINGNVDFWLIGGGEFFCMMFSVCVFGFVKLEFEIFYVVVDVFGVWLVELLYVGDDFYFDIVGVLNVGF